MFFFLKFRPCFSEKKNKEEENQFARNSRIPVKTKQKAKLKNEQGEKQTSETNQ